MQRIRMRTAHKLVTVLPIYLAEFSKMLVKTLQTASQRGQPGFVSGSGPHERVTSDEAGGPGEEEGEGEREAYPGRRPPHSRLRCSCPAPALAPHLWLLFPPVSWWPLC